MREEDIKGGRQMGRPSVNEGDNQAAGKTGYGSGGEDQWNNM